MKQPERKETMEQDMTKGSPFKVLIMFTLPLAIGNIFQQLYNMADTIIVGRYVGADALAAVGSTGTVMFLLNGFAQGITAGFAVLTSQRYGAKKTEGVKQSVSNGILLSVIGAVFFTAASILFMKPLLHLMNTPENIFADAYCYISLISLGMVANVFYNLFSAYLRAVGNSKMPLFFLVLSACLNVVLDLVFIINFQMGVAGAAWATNLSQAISAVLCAVYIYKKVPSLVPEKRHWRIHRGDTRFQLATGIPMALQFAITSSGTMVMQSAINLFGSEAVAAYTAAGKIHSLLTQGMVAMGQTMAVYSGQNYGKGDAARIRQGVRAALVIEVIYSLVSAVIVYSALEPSLGLFFSGEVDLTAMMPWARTYITICTLFYVPLCTIFIFRNTMQGCGYGFLPMMGGVVELVARLAAAVVAMNIHSYWLACACDPAAWVGAGVFTGVSYLYVMNKVQKSLGAGMPSHGLSEKQH
ncbi:MATE family efflux transporter [Enterocloster sp.]|uniref:MATE family efflux transporter n=1 Tax=Enterocloster sp. TaxID=2719315 RepID=UPI003991FC42